MHGFQQRHRHRLCTLFLAVIGTVLANEAVAQTYGERNAVRLEEFIYESAPFPSCHAVSLVETADGTLAATWFGGYHESHPRVGIWLSRKVDRQWTPPVEVVNGLQSDEKYLACWNPVLFQPKNGPLLLFFKVGPSPSTWWGELIRSDDSGKTWVDRSRLPDRGIGPVRCKPLELADGRLLCPSSDETNDVWTSHLETTTDLGKTWNRSQPLHSKEEAQTIQPTLLSLPNGRMTMLCRDKNSNGKIWQAWSDDAGKTWGKFTPTNLPNPNSGIDAVALNDGRFLMIYNHTVGKPRNPDDPVGRNMLNLAVSDDAIHWKAVCVFENSPKGEFSYPAIIQTKDGLVHVAYTWQRKLMKHAVIDPANVRGIPMENGNWPR